MTVYNYTREFPFIWEEIQLPVRYNEDYKLAEEILFACVKNATHNINKLSLDDRLKLDKKYGIKTDDIEPQIYLRMTDNWIELSARFIAPEHGVRKIKDQISRDILDKMMANNISIASTTMDISIARNLN